jgi:Zn-dependent M28 family amino/carboxypeptidase
MDPAEVDQFTAYGKAAGQRVQGPSAAARVGAVAALVRSLTRNADDHPHTGLLVYDEGVPRIPAAALGLRSADRLAALLASGKDVRVRLRLGCRSLGPATTANVLGQVTGSELPGEVIVLGGHLDAWDLGVGAHDDAAGCVQALEAVRLIHALGLTPRRTIRAVMFMDEEFGGTGGDAYASDPHRDQEKHLAAIESDRGGFLPLGFAADGDAAAVARIAAFLPLLRGAGIQWVQAGGGGTDISPLGEKGTLLIGLVPDSQRYFDAHHSVNDVLDAVHPRELELGAIAMAVLAYALANE